VPVQGKPSEQLAVVTWNVRDHREKEANRRDWLTAQLAKIEPQAACIEQIVNQVSMQDVLVIEQAFARCAFLDSSEGQDNAIFATSSVGMEDVPDLQSFQHPAQEACTRGGGLDATVMTVHLSRTNATVPQEEETLLKGLATDAPARDPDATVVGDFNTTEQEIEGLAYATSRKGAAWEEVLGRQGLEPHPDNPCEKCSRRSGGKRER